MLKHIISLLTSFIMLNIRIFCYHCQLFPAMSHLREAVEEISSRSKVKLNFQAPDEIIEDHTHEMVRVKFKVSKDFSEKNKTALKSIKR